ncbi:sugar phosphate isomerase/epimerase [Acidovorax sp. MR-S7]|uniref:sugar phosphate isomerase/epimerase family protein n=1 Tax=Acidovorax sp. MR-S7 TaxID=1268622 RepID=UPI000365573C|nr:sugar phosphate isomerase/epimerase [Acidovorax sp. MR-S7]GAD23061.1 sugar phosphate isomerases/epimerases [Acidovorax sp. MR-S7]
MNRIAFSTAALGGTFGAKVQAMRRAGFQATELWARDLFEHFEGPEIALRMLQDEGMAVAALQAIRHFEGCPPGERAWKLDIARRMMDLANLAGAPLVTLAANSQDSARGDASCLIDDLGELAREAAARGLRIAYEPIAWAPHVNHWRRALELVEAVDSLALGLQLDVFHAFVRGDTRVAVGEIAPQRLFLVEVCDLVPLRMPAIEVSRSYRLLPGEGAMPLEAFFADLRCAGYAGDVVVEIFNAACLAQPAEAVARRAWDSMRPWFDDKGNSR